MAFKAARLRRALGLIVADNYEPLALGAGRRAILSVRMKGGHAEWDWALESRDVDFSATFSPDGGGPAVTITPDTRHSATDGPIEGRYALPAGCEGGTLHLQWSNAYSYLRGKSISYRLVLPDGSEVPQPVIS